MKTLKVSKRQLLELSIFLDRRPQKEFASVKDLRKIMQVSSLLQKQLGEYYSHFGELELAKINLALPYQKEMQDLVQKSIEVVEDDSHGGVRTKPDKGLSPEQKKQKTEYVKKINEINTRANSDSALKQAIDEFDEFQKSNNDEVIETEVDNELYTALKQEFEKHAIAFDWSSRAVLLALTDSFEIS